MTERPEHSPLGGSGVYRYIPCPGSVTLSHGVPDEESDFSALGTAAHTVASTCLSSGNDAWELIGFTEVGGKNFTNIAVDKDMADAVQMYLDHVRHTHFLGGITRPAHTFGIEEKFYVPKLHEHFYGTSDFWAIEGRTLHIWDYKHGAGIMVEVRQNPQCKYYAIGVLEKLDLWEDIDRVVLHIVQPRGFHFDGPVRQWAISVGDLAIWLGGTLIPAMDRALTSTDTASGEHCRFCPARSRQCPQLMTDMVEMEHIMELMKKNAAKAKTPEMVGRFLTLFDLAKIIAKPANKQAFSMLQAGKKVPGFKLARAKSNRVWKDGAEEDLQEKFGDKAYNTKLKSPAVIEGLPEGLEMTARWAFKPDKGETVVAEGDARQAVDKDTSKAFKKVKK